MKIAIMPQPLGSIHGGIMQAWAIQQVLKTMGHELVTIDRRPEQRSATYRTARLASRVAMKATGKRKRPIYCERRLPTLLQHSRSFINQHRLPGSMHMASTPTCPSHRPSRLWPKSASQALGGR
jgi:hypothetical protein